MTTTGQARRPEDFLELVERARRGRLKLYVGFAAGVGKTFRMLQEAHELTKRGVDVAIAYVETHGRADTAALIDGLEVIPRKRLDYRGVPVEELDLDAALRRKATGSATACSGLNQFQPQRPAYHLGRPLQRRECHISILRVQEAADLAAARLHPFGQALPGDVLRLHRLNDLPCQHFLDGRCLKLLKLALIPEKSIERAEAGRRTDSFPFPDFCRAFCHQCPNSFIRLRARASSSSGVF